MNQEPTQDQFDLLTRVIENIHKDVTVVLGITDRLHSFEDIIVKAFVGEYYHGKDCIFVAMRVDDCPERDLPWVYRFDNNNSDDEDRWAGTDEVETKISFCMENMMLDVSEQAKIIYSTYKL